MSQLLPLLDVTEPGKARQQVHEAVLQTVAGVFAFFNFFA